MKHFILPLFLLAGWVTRTEAQLFLTQEEALAHAFSDSQNIQRKTAFLTQEQVEAIQKLANTKVESQLITYYHDATAGPATTYAFFEKNLVRTKEEILMIVLDAQGRVRFVEILAFYEPLDYLPTSKWLLLFRSALLTPNLWPGRDIHNVTGATLTTQAVTAAVRKTLATFKIAVAPEPRANVRNGS